MIRRCKELPENFPVTDDMVFLHGQGSLTEEIEVTVSYWLQISSYQIYVYLFLTLIVPWIVQPQYNFKQRGNIFLCDYKRLDGVTANTINEKKQYLMAPLVLLHKREGKLMPIAIQVR